MNDHRIEFDRPAGHWLEALPVGSGLQGAMVFGLPGEEHLQINEVTAWSGGIRSAARAATDAATAADALARARAAIADGDRAAAADQLQRLQADYSQTYLPFADVFIRAGAGAASEYRRFLDFRAASAVTEYVQRGARVRREVAASHPDRVIVVRLTATGPLELDVRATSPLRVLSEERGEGSLALGLQLPSDVPPPHEPGLDIEWDESPDAALRGAVHIAWSHDGEPTATGARGVRHATIVIATATTFIGIGRAPAGDETVAAGQARRTAEQALARGVDALVARQRADHAELYDRVALELPGTEQRIARMFHFGRYLQISSSRAGGLPSTLQGLWNAQMRPPWSSNYTTNINTEMNYWATETTALRETLPPYLDLVEALARTGAETAERLYGAPGWVAHHNTDAWGFADPVGRGRADPGWAFWPMAGMWLVQQLLQHVEFGADAETVRRIRAVVDSAAEFALHWLQEMPDGTLGTTPSTSPENQFVDADGTARSVSVSSAMDLSLIADVLDGVVALAASAGEPEAPLAVRAREALARLDVVVVGDDGLVQEWGGGETAADPHHRHLSHLHPLYPGTRALDAAESAAFARSLDARGDDATGWSLAWKIALRARLHQPEKVADLLELFFRPVPPESDTWSGGGLYPNLFSAHPPFQIDGNLGFTAAIGEALMQSHRGRIELLRAAPHAWSSGRVRGLVARPGIVCDFGWEPGPDGAARVTELRLRALHADAAGAIAVEANGRSLMADVTEEGVDVAV